MPTALKRLFLSLSIAAAVGAFCFPFGLASALDMPRHAVARVGDDIVHVDPFFLFEVEQLTGVNPLKQKDSGVRLAGGPKQGFWIEGSLQLKSDVRRATAQKILGNEQLYRLARHQGLAPTKAEFEREFAQIIRSGFQGKITLFDRYLHQRGLTREQGRQTIYKDMTIKKFFRAKQLTMKVTDREVRDAYRSSRFSFKHGVWRKVRILTVDTREQAERLRIRIVGGEPMAMLVKSYSTDPSAAEGGVVPVDRKTSDPRFFKIVEQLKTGEVSKPVMTPYGWHLLLPLSPMRGAGTFPLSLVRRSLIERLQSDKLRNIEYPKIRREAAALSPVLYNAAYAPKGQPVGETGFVLSSGLKAFLVGFAAALLSCLLYALTDRAERRRAAEPAGS